jgi:two-component system cell cycle sensor histidine kinase/response regulator CckA
MDGRSLHRGERTRTSEVHAVNRPRPTILLVDDNNLVREVLGQMLTREGYEVLQAEDGRAALAVIDRLRHPVDLLITDVRMPAMGGRELVAALADRHVARHLLFITGDPSGPLLEGVTVLRKPFPRTALLARVRELLGPPPGRKEGHA